MPLVNAIHSLTLLLKSDYSFSGTCSFEIPIWFSFISLFSMDGDFAPMSELAKLRSKHGFLLVIDDVSIASLDMLCHFRGICSQYA